MNAFQNFKDQILANAKTAGACNVEYKKALQSENYLELCKVLKDNFSFAIQIKVLTPEIFTQFTAELANEKIYHNINVVEGYLLAFGSATVEAFGSATVKAFDSATVEAFGSATVEAFDSATVKASGSATVRAFGSATVEASGSATVRAFDSATVEAFGSAYILNRSISECKLSGNAICRVENEIQYVSNELTFVKK